MIEKSYMDMTEVKEGEEETSAMLKSRRLT
jgi:hypothetical protein